MRAVADIGESNRQLGRRVVNATQGAASLGWYRGRQEGWWESYKALKKMGYTRAAERLRDHFGMDQNGDIAMEAE
jgi:hypothetical protein